MFLVNAINADIVKTKMNEEDIHEPCPLPRYLVGSVMSLFKKSQFKSAISSILDNLRQHMKTPCLRSSLGVPLQ